jgi:hypothetical protein
MVAGIVGCVLLVAASWQPTLEDFKKNPGIMEMFGLKPDPTTPPNIQAAPSTLPGAISSLPSPTGGIVLENNTFKNGGVGISAPMGTNIRGAGNNFIGMKKAIEIRPKGQ